MTNKSSENRNLTIQTTLGQIEISKNFTWENDEPVRGMIKITDQENHEIYWVNFDHLVWLGPRWKGPHT